METKDILLSVVAILQVCVFFIKTLSITKKSSGWSQLAMVLYALGTAFLFLGIIYNFSLAKGAYTMLLWITVIVDICGLLSEWKELKKLSFFTLMFGVALALIMSVGYHLF